MLHSVLMPVPPQPTRLLSKKPRVAAYQADIPPFYDRFARFLLPSTPREEIGGRSQVAEEERLNDGKIRRWTVRSEEEKGSGTRTLRSHACARSLPV